MVGKKKREKKLFPHIETSAQLLSKEKWNQPGPLTPIIGTN